ncbi:TonB family protein [uncultured Veillonella sp.]|uniref:TonB family protein n=1 Tax=uncultured Veillonella sp. TaxID=159268 RepID=UPI002610AD13|nr:TonB family protein [uncultured Veillonella sp.]
MEDTAVRDKHAASPFAHIYKDRWKMAITSSLVINFALVAGLVWSLTHTPAVVPDTTPVSISLIGDSPNAGGNGGPQIAAPQKSNIAPPPPLTAQELEDVKNGVPVKQLTETVAPSMSQGATPVSSGGASTATGGGQGSGIGTGTEEGRQGDPNGSEDGVLGGSANGVVQEDVVIAPEYLGPTNIEGDAPGAVTVHFTIDSDGNVAAASISSSSGSRTYDRKVLGIVRSASFSPKTINGTAVSSQATLTFRPN